MPSNSDTQPPLSASRRLPDRAVRRLETHASNDLLGTGVLYYALNDGQVLTSGSVRALARELGQVTLNDTALAELLAFGLVLRDETLFDEIHSLPAHTSLSASGDLTTESAPCSRSTITDSGTAVRQLRGTLDDIIAAEEPRGSSHVVGFTGGKDSRILAALPKSDPDRWHWLSVSGVDDAEQRAAQEHAARLDLGRYHWLEWTSDFLAGEGYRVSADLADGVGAVSDYTLLRSYFEGYVASSGLSEPSLWIGTLADGLLAGTFLAQPADSIRTALEPRTGHLPQALTPRVLELFQAQGAYYDSNPLDFSVARDEEVGYLIRLLTRGRFYLCKTLACFDRLGGAQINPYLHPAIVDLALDTDSRLLLDDALRSGILNGLGNDLDSPSAYGYNAPAYSHHVFRALELESRACAALDGRLDAALVEAMRAGRFPDLTTAAPAPAGGKKKASYRSHAAEPQAVWRNLRDYEHLLLYTTFLNLLTEDGVALS